MNKPKHTPGPWIAQTDESGSSVRSSDHRVLSAIAKCHDQDAALIAAAPELLDALEYAVSKMKTQALTRGCSKGILIATQNAEDAIAKARGE